MRILVLLFALSLTLSAQTKTSDSGDDLAPGHLPVRRVVLYKNGVGYFEHTGRVRGNEEVNIDFTTSQLDDVLKSLTVVDLGEGRVTGVRYNSIAPLEQRLRGLRLPLSEKPTREELLNALLGARVEVRSGAASATGKILSVETNKKQNDRTDESIDVTYLSLITDSGELRSFELTPATSVRIVDRDLNQELNRYFAMVGSSRAKDVRRMTVSTSGTGDRDMVVSYVSEVPVWKTTYRIVIPTDPKRQPLLQGWAVVDNTIGEDWKDVKLSLVAGAPQSFIQQISTPLYARRPVIALPETAQLTPQTHEAAMESKDDVTANAVPPATPARESYGYATGGPMASGGLGGGYGCNVYGTVADSSGATLSGASISIAARNGNFHATSDGAGNYCVSGVAPGTATIRVEAGGFRTSEVHGAGIGGIGLHFSPTMQVGSSTQSVEVTAEAAPVNLAMNGRNFDQLTSLTPGVASQARNIAMEQQFTAAAGREIGELFSYDIKQPITIGKDQSALVPIVQARIDSEKVTIWNGNDIPRRALWVRNTSGETLDSGSFSIVEGDSFAGEGLMDPIKPNERRLLSYAADQSIHVKTEDTAQDEPITHIRVARGLMTVMRQQLSKRTYEVHNADTEERHVVIEHPARTGWKLAKDLKPEETTASLERFLVDVKPGESAKLVVEETHPENSSILLSNITDNLIVLYMQEKVLRPELEKAFRGILEQKNEIADFDAQIDTRQQEMNTISNDQARVRENMKALKGSAEEKALVQRYATEMNSQEDRMGALRAEIASLHDKRDSAGAELDKMLMAVDTDDSTGN